MSFDIEKRFRFVSSDDINDDLSDDGYQANDKLDIGIEEDEGDSAQAAFKKKKTGNEDSDTEELEEDDFEEEDDDDEEDEDE